MTNSNKNRRDVSPSNGAWKVTAPGRDKPTANARTQAAAERVAKRQVADAGGGQVYIHGRNGAIRDADTVKPGNESSRKDTKH